MRSNRRLGTLIALLVILGSGCSSSSQEPAGTGGGSGSASGGTSGGSTPSAGASGGGQASSNSQSASGGSSSSQSLGGGSGGGGASSGGAGGKGGTSATSAGGSSKGGSGGGGGAGGSEKTSMDAGVPDAGGTGSGGRAGGTAGTGGTNAGGTTARSSSTGTPDAGKDASGSESGTGGGSGSFDPCPASGECKILPLGDSITWGVNYDGGYRVKLYASATADKKSITYVGKLSNGPASIPKNNEGHSGWTIQQLDDIVTGKSSDANYSGKKMMVDLAPNIVLLHAGTNDTSRSPTGMPDRLGTLIDHILADGPNVLLVVSTIIPIKQGSYGSVGETFNNAVPGVVQKRIDAGKHVLLVDMFKGFPSAGLSGDGVHPNQQGYDWMAGVWYEAIKSYLH